MVARADDPVRAARLQDPPSGLRQQAQEQASGPTMARRPAGDHPLIHGLVIGPLDLRIQRRIQCRLKEGGAVEDQAEVEKATLAEQRQEGLYGAAGVHQIQEGVRKQQVEGAGAGRIPGEIEGVRGGPVSLNENAALCNSS